MGTSRFTDGFPDEETVAKVFDNLDFQRGVQRSWRRCWRASSPRYCSGESGPRKATSLDPRQNHTDGVTASHPASGESANGQSRTVAIQGDEQITIKHVGLRPSARGTPRRARVNR